MGFHVLSAAIKATGLPQYRLAVFADISESRLSRIIRRGEATQNERQTLSRLLGVDEGVLFGAGPAVSLNVSASRESLPRSSQ
jgi:hypothetical protein